MSRPSDLDSDLQLKMFLRAVGDHPWAGPGLIQAYSGLRRKALDWIVQRRALNERLVEAAVIPAPRRAPRRFGLTPAGAHLLGEPPPALEHLRVALLRALVLDDARLLLAEWAAGYGFAWALSPYTVPAASLRAARGDWRVTNDRWRISWQPGAHGRAGAGSTPNTQHLTPYRSLRLDGLACLTLKTPRGEDGFLNVSLLIDPGQIGLEWFYEQFRSAYAWARREEFRGSARTFPLFLLVAATPERRGRLIALWRECAPWGRAPEMLYVTTRAALLDRRGLKRPWWNERGLPTGLWGGAVPCEQASPKPTVGSWAPAPELGIGNCESGSANRNSQLATRRSYRGARALLAWSEAGGSNDSRLVRDLLAVSAYGRRLLNYVGQYPLLTGPELAAVLGEDAWYVTHELWVLAEREMVTTLRAFPEMDGEGFVLTARGLELLAAQWDHTPAEYARLQRWPLRWEAAGLRYSVVAMVAAREHTRRVLDFLVGLRRVTAVTPRIRLVYWDHVQCLHEFPPPMTSDEWHGTRASPHATIAVRHRAMVATPGDRHTSPDTRLARVKPDAAGRLRALGAIGSQHVDTEFWLEIDRGTVEGRRLRDKLTRYYEARGGGEGMSGRLPRLLIVVERDDEARAQALRRRIERLNERYGVRLDALVARVDLLQTTQGCLDPTRKVWRRPEAWSELAYAFDGLPLQHLPADDPRGWKRLDQRRLQAKAVSRQRRSAAQRARWARMKAKG